MKNFKAGRIYFTNNAKLILYDSETEEEVVCYELKNNDAFSFSTIEEIVKKDHGYRIVNLKKVGDTWMII